MIAARQRLGNGGPTRRVHAGEQDGGLHLRRGHRQIVDDGDEIGGAANLERKRRSRILDGKAHQVEGLKHAPHGPAAQRGIAGELGRDVVPRDDAEHQPAAGPRIAEVERAARRSQAADALADYLDAAVRARDLGAERGHGLGRRHHVLGLEQAGDAGAPSSQGAEDERAM